MKEFIKNSDVFFNFIDDIRMEKNREVVLNKLVESIRDYLSADRCTLFIYDKVNNELVSRVAQGADEVRLPADGSSLSSFCFTTGDTRFTNDAYSEKKLRAIESGIQVSSKWDDKHSYRTKSALVTPITARGERIGVFLAMNKPGGFIDSSVDGVIEFVSLLGLAVEIVLLDEALREGKSMETLPF
ncbi:MAG: GAF domain-containing protein [Mariprofundaceae bacterium]